MKTFGAVLARVERLADAVRVDGCDGHHSITHCSTVEGDAEPDPPWPPPDAPEFCVCGARIRYTHVIHQLGR